MVVPPDPWRHGVFGIAVCGEAGWGGDMAAQAGLMLIYSGSLAIMPIGGMVARMFTSPLMGVAFQGTRVGLVRGIAIVLGFITALLVIRPEPAALGALIGIGFLQVSGLGYFGGELCCCQR